VPEHVTRIEATATLLRDGLTVRVSAFGHSMTPAIASGDALIVQPASPGALRVGDVVLCRMGNHLVAHRIAGRRRGPTFLLRCDQTGSDDGWIDAEQILGSVIAVEHNGQRRAIPYHPWLLLARRLVTELRTSLVARMLR
jgi:hypothetical protein